MSAVETITRIERLNSAASKRVVDPDNEIAGRPGPGQIIPDELLSVAGLALELTPEQKAKLSREEIASIAAEGIRFEAVLTAGFGLEIATAPKVTDPRVTFLLHEIGEESRHSRLFVRLIEGLEPTAESPFDRPIFKTLMRFGVRQIISRPALLYTLVLGGEEIPDLLQKLASEHPDTDDFVRAVNKYHRMEEARHLSYARAVLPEVWAKASWHDKYAVRRIAPLAIKGMFETLVHPGVYESIGLPGWETWKAVNRSPERIAIRHQATRPVLDALVDGGVFSKGRIPKRWQKLCGVDRGGEPV
ncbi:MAG TPA: diiron oxygenase [Acidimicrobiales bacterium]|jgi:hypothetical protein|nr:diiron oxygenase [Acidimicrobiales bacterium]